MRARAVIARLDLKPHPEGGWYRETWRAAPAWQPDGYPGPRAAATGIYFLLTPGEESAWHRVRSDEVWLWHSGGPLTGATNYRVKPGDFAVIPPYTWHQALPDPGQTLTYSMCHIETRNLIP